MRFLTERIDNARPPRLLVLVFVVAILVRLAFLAVKPHAWTPQLQTGDAPLYHGIAISVLEGRGFSENGRPTARRVPLYPLFLASVYWVSGVSPPAARVAHAVLGGLLCVLVAGLAMALWGRMAGLCAGILTAFYYPFVQLPLYLMTENLYLPLFLAAMAITWWGGMSVTRQGDNRPPFLGGVAGGMWGLSALTRPLALPLAFLITLWLMARRLWRTALLLITATGLTLLPWVIRNYRVFHTFIPSELSLGHNLYLAFGPEGTGPKVLGHWNWGTDVQRPLLPPGLSPVERDNFLKRFALENIRTDPMGAVLRRIPRKLLNFLTPFYGTASLVNKVLTTVSFGLMLLLGVPGLIRAWRSDDPSERAWAELVTLTVAFTIAFHALFYGVVRYRYPLDALLLVFAGRSLRNWKRDTTQ